VVGQVTRALLLLYYCLNTALLLLYLLFTTGVAGEGEGEGGGGKYKRRNIERHLAAERDRRKATKNKVNISSKYQW
jgi:hypothetical protein